MNLRHLLTDTFAFMPPHNILADLSDPEATRRIENSPHSVAEVVAHMKFWQAWFLQRCQGQAEPMAASATLGWPDAPAGSWSTLLEDFLRDLEAAAALSDQQENLAKPIEPAIDFPPLAGYTIGEALMHIACHNAHHFGQIITLRQMAGKWPPPAGSWTW